MLYSPIYQKKDVFCKLKRYFPNAAMPSFIRKRKASEDGFVERENSKNGVQLRNIVLVLDIL